MAGSAKATSPWRAWLGLLGVGLFGGSLTIKAYVSGMPDWIDEYPQLDKLIHFVIAGVFTYFLDGVFRQRNVILGRLKLPVAASLVLVATAIEEYAQHWFPTRSSSWGDFAADAAGILAFAWLARRRAI